LPIGALYQLGLFDFYYEYKQAILMVGDFQSEMIIRERNNLVIHFISWLQEGIIL